MQDCSVVSLALINLSMTLWLTFHLKKRSCSLMQCLVCLEPPDRVQVASACLCSSLSPSSNLHKSALMRCWGCTHGDVGPDVSVFMHVLVCVTQPSCDSCALFNSTLKNQASLSTHCLSQTSPTQSTLGTSLLHHMGLAMLTFDGVKEYGSWIYTSPLLYNLYNAYLISEQLLAHEKGSEEHEQRQEKKGGEKEGEK